MIIPVGNLVRRIRHQSRETRALPGADSPSALWIVFELLDILRLF